MTQNLLDYNLLRWTLLKNFFHFGSTRIANDKRRTLVQVDDKKSKMKTIPYRSRNIYIKSNFKFTSFRITDIYILTDFSVLLFQLMMPFFRFRKQRQHQQKIEFHTVCARSHYILRLSKFHYSKYWMSQDVLDTFK